MARNRIVDELVVQLASEQHGAFALHQLEGVCDRRVAADRVKSREWLRFLPGTFALPGHLDEWTGPAAMCLHTAPAVVADVAAGRWWGFAGLQSAPDRLVVPSSCGVRHPMLRRVDDLLPWEIRHELGGCLRITDPTRTLIDLGGVLGRSHLERAIESALRAGLTSEPRLRLRARQLKRPGRPGSGAALTVLDGRPVGGCADSDGEVVLLQLLRAAGLPEPVRQHGIGPWRFDLAWPLLLVAVELDGAGHRQQRQLQRDDRKQNAGVLAGWTILRYTWDRIELEPDAVVAEILAALNAARRAVS